CAVGASSGERLLPVAVHLRHPLRETRQILLEGERGVGTRRRLAAHASGDRRAGMAAPDREAREPCPPPHAGYLIRVLQLVERVPEVGLARIVRRSRSITERTYHRSGW